MKRGRTSFTLVQQADTQSTSIGDIESALANSVEHVLDALPLFADGGPNELGREDKTATGGILGPELDSPGEGGSERALVVVSRGAGAVVQDLAVGSDLVVGAGGSVNGSGIAGAHLALARQVGREVRGFA